jgi:hypothetical protein
MMNVKVPKTCLSFWSLGIVAVTAIPLVPSNRNEFQVKSKQPAMRILKTLGKEH